MSYVYPDTIFAFLVDSYGTVAIFVYILIAVSQLRLRARLEREDPARLRIRMWAYPYLTYLAIAGMLGIVLAMAFIPEQRTPLIFGFVSLGLLLLGFVRAPAFRRPAAARVDRGRASPIRRVVDLSAGTRAARAPPATPAAPLNIPRARRAGSRS